ncbi:uncharacterized protein [Branchiostoma lanceolatum]|uniref:uncharacterized protein n=1 Tax=Branchiostoma lanceolatum TaxID=7740 RepID=UPI003452029C
MSNKARRMLVLLLIVLKEAGPTAACSSSRCSSGSGCSSSSCSSHCYCIRKGLTSVPQDLPTTITVLDLDNNAITNLRQSDFSRYRRLTGLYFSDNQISMIHNKTFNNLISLTYLNLDENQITNLPADIFVDISNLEWLDLHQNQITSLSADTFEGLGKLRTLWLYQNQITNLPADIFAGLGSLERLSLNWNDIRSIEAGMFNDTTQLRSLDLGYNSISTIAADIYDILARIPTVYIGNNIWQCDCRIAPFKQRMNGSYPFENQIICAGPGNLTGQYLRDVNPEDLICEETTPVYFTLSTKRIVASTLNLSTISSSSTFHHSAKSTSKAQTLSPTPSNTPTADRNPGWSTARTDSRSPFAFQSTITEIISGPTGGGIVLSVPILATLCVFLGLFIISAIALTVWCMYKRRERDPNSVQNSSNSNPAGTSSGHDQIRQPAGINSQMLHHGTEDSQHIYNVPTDDVDTEYNTISEINESEGPHQGAGNMQSLDSVGYLVLPPPLPPENQTGPQASSQSESADAAACTVGGRDTWTDEAEYNDVISPSQGPQPASDQIQHLGSFNNGYKVPSLSLCPENGADPKEREGPQSHKYENSQVIAAAKDAAAGPQFIEYENDEGIEARKEGPQSPKYENSQVIAAAAKDAAAGPQFIEYENDEGIEARKEGQQSPKYENSQVIAAAAKDAAAVPQAIVYQNDDESIDNQSKTAAAPGADSPNHYEPLRNPSSQQQHT